MFKKVFDVYKEYFSKKKKNPISESPYRFPLSPSVFNSRLSLSRTGLAGHPHQVLCPDSYPPKWPDVWHTFLAAKGVDNSTRGSKMTKIELTPKYCWTQPLFYSSAFFDSPWTESLRKSFAIYKLFCKCKASFKKKTKLSVGSDVMIRTPTTLGWHTEEQFFQQKTLQGSFERRIDLFQVEKMKRKFWVGKNMCIGRKASSKNSKIACLACSGGGQTIAGEKAKVSCCRAVFATLGIWIVLCSIQQSKR